jgi:acetyl-CoA carboxylase carboxyl transferase subunit beta
VCHSHYRDDELRERLRVCGQCGYHFPVGARERIEQLADDGTFVEHDADLRSADPLAFVDLKAYTDRLAAAELETGLGDAMVIGTASITGRPTILATMDFGFMGGSMGSVVGEKFARACDLAIAHDVPLVCVAASGGARMQEGALSLMQMPRTTIAVEEVKEAGLPYIAVLTDPTTGGVTASFAMLGDIAIAEPGAQIGFAGRRVIEQTIRENLPEGFQKAEYLLEHGMIDMVVHRFELRALLARLLRLLLRPDLDPDAAPPVERVREPAEGDGLEHAEALVPAEAIGSDGGDDLRQ